MNSKNKIVILIILAVLIIFKGYLFSIKYKSDESEKEYIVFVENIKSISDTKIAYNVKLLNSNDKFVLNIYDNSYDKVQTGLSIHSNYKYGDVVKVKGKIFIPKLLNNPGEFNYKQYLYSNNVHGLINTYETLKQIQYTPNYIEKGYSKIYDFKRYIKKLINLQMSSVNANVAISMIYGDTTNLDEQIQEDFESLGVSHLMSVSGTHITSFMLIINLILGDVKGVNGKNKNDRNNNTKKIIKSIIQIFAILLYITFTGFGISALRAGIMIIVCILCDMFEFKKEKYTTIFIAMLLILINSPFAIFNTGFRLSFMATLGILTFRKYIFKLFKIIINKVKNSMLKKSIKYIAESIAITFAVQLFILPIQIQTFNQLSFPIIIPNVILGLVSIPIRVIGTIGIMLAFIPKISLYFFSITELFVVILLKISSFLESFSISISTVSQPLIFFVVYYLSIFIMFLYIKLKKVIQESKGKTSFLKLSKCLKALGIFLMAGTLIILTVTNIYSIYYSGYVYFFNVEQGEMSYIKSGDKSIIVDIGSMRNGLSFNTISNFFKANNLYKVDSIILSHIHSDHVNGLEEFIKNYEVGNVIYTRPEIEDKEFKKFIKILKENNVNKVEAKRGDKFKIGDITIEVLLPDGSYIKEDSENENSLICKVSVKDKSILYMGDASKNAEEKLLKEKTDLSNIYILKVGHHGSKTATTEEFIQKVRPKYAVISALKKYYGHPHENTIQTLNKYKVHTYMTETIGAIKFNLQ